MQVLVVGQRPRRSARRTVRRTRPRACRGWAGRFAPAASRESARRWRGQPLSSSAKPLGAERQHDRQADGGPQRVAAADPVPEAEHVLDVDAERSTAPVGVRGDSDEMTPDCLASPRSAASSSTRARPGVGHRLQGGEGLRGDDESVSAGRARERLGECGAIDVGDEAGARPVARRARAPRGHDRAEVRAADPDVDDVADRPAGGWRRLRPSGPRRRRPPSGRARLVHLRLYDVRAVDDQRAPRPRLRSATCRTARSSETLIRRR